MSHQSPRTKAKIEENLGLLMKGLRGKYGTVDEWIEQQIFSALSWTADDVQEQCEQVRPTQPVDTVSVGKLVEKLHQIASECDNEENGASVSACADELAALAEGRSPTQGPDGKRDLNGLRALPGKWREAIVKLKAGVEDSPSYDLKRMIKERAEAFMVCAEELEAALSAMTHVDALAMPDASPMGEKRGQEGAAEEPRR